MGWKEAMLLETTHMVIKLYLMPMSCGYKDKGPRPKAYYLFRAGYCNGCNINTWQNGVQPEVKVETDGELTEEHPKYYHKMHLVMSLKARICQWTRKGCKSVAGKILRVSAMLSKAATITHEIVIES